jgi:hypothetical protein
MSIDPVIPEERCRDLKDVRGAFVDCLLGYISAMMLLNFSQITLSLLAWYVVSTYFVFVLGYKSICGSRRENP